MGYRDYYKGPSRDYHRDPFPHSLSTRELLRPLRYVSGPDWSTSTWTSFVQGCTKSPRRPGSVEWGLGFRVQELRA